LIPAWPLEVLRVLPDEYLRSLPGDVQEQIQKRLREAAH
jgi:putative heme iron utilization protein